MQGKGGISLQTYLAKQVSCMQVTFNNIKSFVQLIIISIVNDISLQFYLFQLGGEHFVYLSEVVANRGIGCMCI